MLKCEYLLIIAFLFISLLSCPCVFAQNNVTDVDYLEINDLDNDSMLEEGNKENTIILSQNVTKYYHGEERFYATLLDSTYTPIANQTISILINGVNYDRQTDELGIVSIGLNLNSGNYTTLVSYAGNDLYNPSNHVYNVEIKPTIIGFDVIKIVRNSTQYISLFFSSQGVALQDTDVTFNINGIMYHRRTNSSGWATLNINLDEGEYILTAYNPVTTEQLSNRIIVISKIISQDIVKYYGSYSPFIVRIYANDESFESAGKLVKFNINGVIYKSYTNGTGHASLSASFSPGSYIVTTMYENCFKSNNIEVLPIITAYDLHRSYDEDIPFIANVVDDYGNPLSGQTVRFTINGYDIYNETNINGTAEFSINLYPGEYNVTTFCRGCSLANTIYIYQSHNHAIMNSQDFTWTVGNNQYFYVNLEYNGVPLANKKIIFNIKGIDYIDYTDSNGFASIVDKNLNEGEYLVKTIFEGDSSYSAIHKQNYWIVHKKSTVLSVINSPSEYDESMEYSVKLTDNTSTPISNKIIFFEIQNKIYYNITNNEGIAKCIFNPKYENFTIKASFTEDDECLQSNVSSHINFNGINVFINKNGGYYNLSSLNITISSNIKGSYVFYSFDNENWFKNKNNITLILPRGSWNLYYYSGLNNHNTTLKHKTYHITNKAPLVFANYGTDVYNSPIQVNLSYFDYCDLTVKIYYTIDGSDPLTNGIRYTNPFTISNTTCLKFYAKNFFNMYSNVTSIDYLFGQIANLNSKKLFNTIQEAVNDYQTANGDIIRVGPGSYPGGIQVTKEVIISGKDNPVIYRNNGGFYYNSNGFIILSDNVTIEGFSFLNILDAITLNTVSNCIIQNNYFPKVYASIVCSYSNNCIIKNNRITPEQGFVGSNVGYEDKSYGIVISNSSDLIIKNNYIELNSSGLANGLSYGIFSDYLPSKNLFIYNNTIIASYQKCGMSAGGDNIFIFNNTISGFEYGIYCRVTNSEIYYNNINNNLRGLFFESVNSSFYSNNIYNNNYGVIQNTTSNTTFYLNRFMNRIYNFYSDCDNIVDISDNWWGTNDITQSKIVSNYNNLIMNSWIFARLECDDYFIMNNIVRMASIHINMNYNNLGTDLSNKGFLMDGIGVEIDIYGGNNASYHPKLKNGIASVYVNLYNLYNNQNKVTINGTIDLNLDQTYLEKYPSISYALYSSASNITHNRTFLNDSFNYCNESCVSWFTTSWRETGLYTGVIDIIINGEVVNSINITNNYYQQYKNNYRENVFRAMLMFNNIFASTKEGDFFSPNNLLFQLKIKNYVYNMDNSSITQQEALNNFIGIIYSLSDSEKSFILQNHEKFVDYVIISITYGAASTPNIILNASVLKFPSGTINRQSYIYYTNIEDGNQSIGYEGMRSFALATSKVTDYDLQYWLDKSIDYAPGLMKAAYGTFLTDLIFLYEHDYVADLAAEEFNVNWQRTSPVGFSLCNDYNCLYITGESDHSMGMTVTGNAEDVWKFRFTCSFAYSLLEQLVGTNIWKDHNIGSVTLGLLQRYMNNESLELIYENGYYFLKVYGDNASLLVFDPVTGLVRDIYRINGLLGTMPCYHDGITDNAIAYANNLLDETSIYNIQLDSIHDFSSSIALIGGFFVSDSLAGTGGALTLAELSTSNIAFMIIALPIIFELNRPKLAEMLEKIGFHEMAEYSNTNNTIDILWDAIEYLNLGELDNVPFEQRLIFALFYLSSMDINVLFTSHLIINPNSDLNYIINILTPDLKEYDQIITERKIIGKNGHESFNDKPLPPEENGKKLREAYDHAKLCWKLGKYVEFFKNWLIIDFIIFTSSGYFIDAFGEEIIDILTGLNNTIKG